jgi:hypothetical protein
MRHLLTALHSFNPKSMVLQKSQPHVFVGAVEILIATYFDTVCQIKSGQINLSFQLSIEEI